MHWMMYSKELDWILPESRKQEPTPNSKRAENEMKSCYSDSASRLIERAHEWKARNTSPGKQTWNRQQNNPWSWHTTWQQPQTQHKTHPLIMAPGNQSHETFPLTPQKEMFSAIISIKPVPFERAVQSSTTWEAPARAGQVRNTRQEGRALAWELSVWFALMHREIDTRLFFPLIRTMG